jgi:hypothetical protein
MEDISRDYHLYEALWGFHIETDTSRTYLYICTILRPSTMTSNVGKYGQSGNMGKFKHLLIFH